MERAIVPKVFFLKENQRFRAIYFDEGDKIDEITVVVREQEENDLCGEMVEDLLFIYQDSIIGKVVTLFHEVLHFINWRFLGNTELVDKLIDFWL